ncbi:MAG: polysaccharide biosynthesis/export family protein [Verrucomicrobiota bacterium]|mgnify:CR=1 FL=1|nr:polysaccharide biosynthesis/export family protein [Verrucomicrobiota bacterium]
MKVVKLLIIFVCFLLLPSLCFAKDATIKTGDIVQISLLEDSDFNGQYKVDDSGQISLKYAGFVKVVGGNEYDAKYLVTKALLKKYFKKATPEVIHISMQQLGIAVVGAVMKPGVIPMVALKDKNLLEAISQAGGIRPEANLQTVKLIKNGQISVLGALAPGQVFDITPLLKPENKEKKIDSPLVTEGDMIVVPYSAAPDENLGRIEIVINGQVIAPGPQIYRVGEEATVMRALIKAGGLGRWANGKKTQVVRYNDQKVREEITIDAEALMNEGKKELDIPLKNGDTIIVPEKKIGF